MRVSVENTVYITSQIYGGTSHPIQGQKQDDLYDLPGQSQAFNWKGSKFHLKSQSERFLKCQEVIFRVDLDLHRTSNAKAKSSWRFKWEENREAFSRGFFS